jgi:2-iminoacetate synthase
MTTQTNPSLESLAAWIRETDVHAAHRLPLLGHADGILSGDEKADSKDRADLAVRLERWRYQYINEGGNARQAMGRELVNILDMAANELAGRNPRPPRDTRNAIGDESLDTGSLADAIACLDPDTALDGLADRARRITQENFAVTDSLDGCAARRMLLYAPLYLSSHCINHCAYCGFRYPLDIERKHLSTEQALAQADILRGRGFKHILLVGGDFPSLTTSEYYTEIIGRLAAQKIALAVEIAPQGTDAYARMVQAGARGVTLYQETYNEELYAVYHPRGTKSSFDWRLEGLDRAAETGMGRLGLGILLGLAEPRQDLLALMRHGRYLQTRFPESTLAFSLPRIHDAPDNFQPPYTVDDETFVRFYCVLRVAFPRAELVLSTREPESLRHRLARIVITQMSAGSSTIPGGYEDSDSADTAGEQFPVCDQRTPAEVAQWLRNEGFEPTWEL